MRLIDAFMFFDELDLLEIRLNEMAPIVDTFVIVESLERFGSAKKKLPLLYQNWERFKPFAGKIRHIILQSLIPEYTGGDSGWLRESYQRNSLMGGILEVANLEDAVIISDCDEIPRSTIVKENLSKFALGTLFRLEQDMFHYSVNRYVSGWCSAVVGTVAAVQQIGGPQKARSAILFQQIENAGWHFSYFGGIQQIREKVESFSHSSEGICVGLLQRDDGQVSSDVLLGKDIFRRSDIQFSWRDTTDPRLPLHFLNNLESYKQLTEEFLKSEYRECSKD